jgi:TonB family protein
LLVFGAAILASLSVHLPVYTVLGTLADVLLHTPDAPPSTPIEFEIAALQDAPEAESQSPSEQQAPNLAQPEPSAPPPEAALAQPKVDPKEPEPPKPNLNILPTPAVPPPPAAPPPEEQPNKLAVTQKSEDPNVAPPEDAKYIAEENRRVAEETIASVTNLDADDPVQLPPSASSDDQAPGQGDEETRPADLRNHDGEQTRAPTEQEAKAETLSPDSQPSHGERSAPAVASAPTQGGAPGAEREQRALQAGADAVGGEDEVVVIDDGMGRIRVRRAFAGRGEGNEGGLPQRGAATAERAEHAGARAGKGSNLKLSFSQFESTFGAEQLREQRESYMAQRRSESRGGSREEDWRKFRSAIENFVPNVKPGNQTALNAAASPFAAYLADMHRLIHREFAMRFLRDLPVIGGPYDDYSLFTKLEIAINRDGSLHKVGVVQASGYLPFDYGAWNAVERAAPFSQPPSKILSGDGRAYVRWGFYRNERQCGTFNAEPYILPNPPGVPAPPPNPMSDDVPPDSKLGALPVAPAGVLARHDADHDHDCAWTH